MDNQDGGFSRAQLQIWTVYENPSDYPGLFVLRRYDILRNGRVVPNREVATAPDRAGVEAHLPPGLAFLPRDPRDPPSVVGSWI